MVLDLRHRLHALMSSVKSEESDKCRQLLLVLSKYRYVCSNCNNIKVLKRIETLETSENVYFDTSANRQILTSENIVL